MIESLLVLRPATGTTLIPDRWLPLSANPRKKNFERCALYTKESASDVPVRKHQTSSNEPHGEGENGGSSFKNNERTSIDSVTQHTETIPTVGTTKACSRVRIDTKTLGDGSLIGPPPNSAEQWKTVFCSAGLSELVGTHSTNSHAAMVVPRAGSPFPRGTDPECCGDNGVIFKSIEQVASGSQPYRLIRHAGRTDC